VLVNRTAKSVATLDESAAPLGQHRQHALPMRSDRQRIRGRSRLAAAKTSRSTMGIRR
jgi:hypothetical protein